MEFSGVTRGEADRWGPLVSERKTKEKERRRCGLARGEGRWAAGPLGQKGREVSFLFFSFLFQTLFKSNFSFKIQTKILQTFYKIS
jgi:hypothetical protein